MFFFIKDNKDYFHTKFDNYLAVHEEPEQITYFRNYRYAWTVLYIETWFTFLYR